MSTSSPSLRGFILGAALIVSLIISLGLYFTITGLYTSAARQSAHAASSTLAEGTFNAMFQIMRKGWTRDQLEEFIAAVQRHDADSPYTIDIYRGAKVEQLFGSIRQKPIVGAVQESFAHGVVLTTEDEEMLGYTYPLVARHECLRCHENAHEGDVLGVIAVEQRLAPFVEEAKRNLLPPLLLLAPLPLLIALVVVYLLNKRVTRAMERLRGAIGQVSRVSDLTHVELPRDGMGFSELDEILGQVGELGRKMRSVAVDKELLEFEIRLLEKFVITSEVVRDWRDYICNLLIDINQVIEAHTLFSIFKVDEELFDLEIFWHHPPTAKTRELVEQEVRRTLERDSHFAAFGTVQINHQVALHDAMPLDLTLSHIDLQTKSLLVDTPKIGGIVGIGVNAGAARDQTRALVVDSILSTLLNVVGSVKAIYKYTKDLEYYATRDPLTNLYNQRIFWELLNYEVNRAGRHDYSFSLLVIDMDNFKTINDSHGHGFGDSFLRHFSSLIQQALGTGDVLARYGGDEFVAILPESDANQAETVCRRLLQQSQALGLTAPDGSEVHATISIGVALYPDHATDAKDLFLFADNMMYKAKTEGKNRIGFPDQHEMVEVFRSIGERTLVIASAIEKRMVEPFFQPILDTRSGEVEAVEVLSRIRREDGSLMGAHEFIEIAEKAGLIHQLDQVVMEKALQVAAEQGYRGKLFLNISPRALVLHDFLRFAVGTTQRFGIATHQVVFEITERDTVKNFEQLERFVHQLKELGFGLAIDDFGSGFSSFHYLKHFPTDYVKIEGDFIVNMATDPRDRAFVVAIAQLCEQLGIRSLAEYVENQEVLEQVHACGIHLAQGYHIGRPAPELVTHVAHIRPLGRDEA